MTPWVILAAALILALTLAAIAFIALSGTARKASSGRELVLTAPETRPAAVRASFDALLRALGDRITTSSFQYRVP